VIQTAEMDLCPQAVYPHVPVSPYHRVASSGGTGNNPAAAVYNPLPPASGSRRRDHPMTDGQLLASYVADPSGGALERLVERHAPMVYATCLRVTGERRLAEEATQAVFLMMARSARQLCARRVLCGWMHSAAYRAACLALERQAGGEVLIETRELAAVD
jgi:hypothetical protein